MKTLHFIVVKMAFCRGGPMPRGVMPRRPAKTGRHEGARLNADKIAAPSESGKGVGRSFTSRSPGAAKVAKKPALAASQVGVSPAPKSYNPTSPERISGILK